jgi:hypothetical protein
VGKSDILNEPALRGTSGETGDSVNREAVFGDASRPDVSDSGGIGDEPALSGAGAAEAERWNRAEWLEARWRDAPSSREWFLIPLLMVVSGLAAVGCTVLKGGGGSMALATAVLAPVVEETSKIIVPAMILERRPWRFSSAVELLVVCAFSGLVFATIENFLYIFVYIPKEQLTIGILLWRLSVCTLLHVSCASISGFGLGRVWRTASERRSMAEISRAAGFVVAAMVLHGLYNFGTLIYAVVTRNS